VLRHAASARPRRPCRPGAARGPPTAAQLAAARAGYRAAGGKAEEWDGADDDSPERYRLTPPEPLTADAVARLPDLGFGYELRVCLTPVTPPEAVAALARLRRLRSVWLDPPLDSPPDAYLPHLKALRALPALERLDLGQGFVLTPAAAAAVVGVPRLRWLAARASASDAALAVLAGHPALAHVTVWADGVTDAGVGRLAAMPALRSLDVSHCGGVTPAVLGPFAAAGRLTALAVAVQPRPEGRPAAAGPLLAAVGRMAGLEEVAVGGYRSFTRTDADLDHLALRRLRLPWHWDVPDGFLARLAACPRLADLAAGGRRTPGRRRSPGRRPCGGSTCIARRGSPTPGRGRWPRPRGWSGSGWSPPG
jgi:hypothetical protein